MAIGIGVAEIMGIRILVGVGLMSWISHMRMGNVRPRFTQVASKRKDFRFLLALFYVGKINDLAWWQANVKAHEGDLYLNAAERLAFQYNLHACCLETALSSPCVASDGGNDVFEPKLVVPSDTCLNKIVNLPSLEAFHIGIHVLI